MAGALLRPLGTAACCTGVRELSLAGARSNASTRGSRLLTCGGSRTSTEIQNHAEIYAQILLDKGPDLPCLDEISLAFAGKGLQLSASQISQTR